jgi:hypothetical protein
MADSFINKLNETNTVKGGDYTVFDISDSTSGGFFTKKITYENLSNKIKVDVSAALQVQIDTLQNNLNIVSKSIGDKLDKKGLTFGSNEKMTGTLVLNSGAQLSALDVSHFNNTLNTHNNNIVNLKDGVADYDAINLHQLRDAINGISIPDTSTFVLKTGSIMTGALKLPAGDPTDPLHAANKQYVDNKLSTVSPGGKYLPLSGGTMTGAITLPSGDPSNDLHAANKQYVDKFKPSPLVYLPLSGGTMTGELNIKGFSETNTTADLNASVTNLNLLLGNTFSFNLGSGSSSFTLYNVPTNSFSFTIILTQKGTPAGTVSWNFGSSYTVKWANAATPIVSADVGKVDIYSFMVVGTTIYGFVGGQRF